VSDFLTKFTKFTLFAHTKCACGGLGDRQYERTGSQRSEWFACRTGVSVLPGTGRWQPPWADGGAARNSHHCSCGARPLPHSPVVPLPVPGRTLGECRPLRAFAPSCEFANSHEGAKARRWGATTLLGPSSLGLALSPRHDALFEVLVSESFGLGKELHKRQSLDITTRRPVIPHEPPLVGSKPRKPLPVMQQHGEAVVRRTRLKDGGGPPSEPTPFGDAVAARHFCVAFGFLASSW
jgi:hypothetical protein